MRQEKLQGSSEARSDAAADHPPFVPSIATEDVFRRMVTDDLRSGRWTPARGREMVGFARQFGLSAGQAEQLIESCLHAEAHNRRNAAHDDGIDDPDLQAPRLLRPVAYMFAGVFLIVLDLIILKWFR